LHVLWAKGIKFCEDRKIFKPESSRQKVMMHNWRDDLWADSGYRIRCIQSLIGQIKSDYAGLNAVLEIKSGGDDIVLSDGVLEKISWIRQALKRFDRLQRMDIEGVFSSEVEAIRKDIRAISGWVDRG
jgi:hypothetical protein